MRWSVKRRWRWIVTSAALATLVGIGVWLVAPRPVAQVAAPTVSDEQLDAVSGTTLLFGHQSVGMNVLDGIAGVYRDASRPPPAIVEAGAEVDRPSIVHAFVGVNGDPLGKFHAFRELVDAAAGAAPDVALVKLCYTDITSATDARAVFEEYRALMSDLETRHPDITFLYTTVPLTTDRSWRANLKALFGSDDQRGPADNLVREAYNTLIRDEYASSGRLFDIAAVEATLSTDPMTREHHGERYHVLNSALGADAGHLNDVGARTAAAELMRVIADLDE